MYSILWLLVTIENTIYSKCTSKIFGDTISIKNTIATSSYKL